MRTETLERYTATAISDPKSIKAVHWLVLSQEKPEYPSAAELGDHLLGEFNYLGLTRNGFYFLPGGAASPLAEPVLDEILGKIANGEIGAEKKTFHILAMIHGSKIPYGQAAVKSLLVQEDIVRSREPSSTGLGGSSHYNHLHAATSCGVSEGVTAIARARAEQNLARVVEKWRDDSRLNGKSIIFYTAEALIGSRTITNTAATPVHEHEQIYYHLGQSYDLKDKRAMLFPGENSFYTNAAGLSRFIRDLMLEGSVDGVGCVDRRQGTFVDPIAGTIDLDLLMESIKRGRLGELFGRSRVQAEELLEHTESLILALDGQDERMLRVAWQALTQPWAMIRQDVSGWADFVTGAGPSILKLPEAVWRIYGDNVRQTVRQLVSNIDYDVRRKPFRHAPRDFVQADNGLSEIISPAGLQILMQSGPIADVLSRPEVRPGLPFITEGLGYSTHPDAPRGMKNGNPRIISFTPTRYRKLGSII